uniref:Transposase MuDR plant domain-containing protein n=1 Tax=Lactuca sativa TaxID=4236 RepID=A0A9R1VE11_LACSA|nr:hypothetical protein LSAT_V11C500290130 [Lactuca sativa]
MVMSSGGPIRVYVDQFNEPLFDWIHDELLVEAKDNIQTSTDEESKQEESLTCDDIPFLHTPEDEVNPSLINTLNDKFLSKLVITNDEKGDIDDSQFDTKNEVNDQTYYPIFDPNTYWKSQKPILGVHFESPKQLKFMIQNYAVENGYPLWFQKNEHIRVLLRRGKYVKDNEEQCTFRLWES